MYLNNLIYPWPKNNLCQVLLKFAQWFWRRRFFPNYLPLEKGRALHLNKLKFPSPNDTLCQVSLKLDQWFWRRWFFKFVNVFSQFCNHLPLEKNWPFIWANLNPLHPLERILWAKFGWNWPSSSGEEHFLKLSMYFFNFVIISHWKRIGLSLE